MGLLAGIGFVAAGLSSVLIRVPMLGPVLRGVGGLGLAVFAAWDLVVGWRLLTL